MNIFLIGICGTFMAGLAMLAREKGHRVSGSDAQVYPPMSTQLSDAGITLHEGYDVEALPADVDMFIIGNAVTRGNPQFEAILNNNRPYTSGPQWLHQHLLQQRWVLAVSGTHGKTTTSSMLAWILQFSGLNPGYLIGGISQNFNQSAKLGDDPFFVIEADEYDTALFDKRSKFVHYNARTLIINNLEYDHADIFPDLDAIKRQFHHLVRTLPANGLIIHNGDSDAIDSVLGMGCWTQCLSFAQRRQSADFILDEDAILSDTIKGRKYPLQLEHDGLFNAMNASAAVLAARHAGVPVDTSIEALKQFKGVKRRQEIIAEINGVRFIDDFAHHPTAIELTLQALKGKTSGKLYAVVDIRSNTMKMGSQSDLLAKSLGSADTVLLCENPSIQWDLHKMAATAPTTVVIKPAVGEIIDFLVNNCQQGDQVVIMSNGGFDNIHNLLVQAMQSS